MSTCLVSVPLKLPELSQQDSMLMVLSKPSNFAKAPTLNTTGRSESPLPRKGPEQGLSDLS